MEIPAQDVEPYDNGQPPKSYLAAFFQLVHLATLAGIGRAAVAEAAVAAVDEVYLAEAAGHAASELLDRADAAVYAAQGQVIALVLGLATELFEVGGASAVTERFHLDRHWRNARTLASHNPVIYRDRIVGDYVLNGTNPGASYARSPERNHGI